MIVVPERKMMGTDRLRKHSRILLTPKNQTMHKAHPRQRLLLMTAPLLQSKLHHQAKRLKLLLWLRILLLKPLTHLIQPLLHHLLSPLGPTTRNLKPQGPQLLTFLQDHRRHLLLCLAIRDP